MILLGNADAGFPLQPQTKDAGALFWFCPSETIRIQCLSSFTKQKAQGLFLRGWTQPCFFSKQRWQNTRCAVWKHVLCKCASEWTCFWYLNVSLRCHMKEQHCCCCSSALCFATHFVRALIFLSSLWGEKNIQMDYSVLRYMPLQCLPKQGWNLHYSTVRSSCHLLNAVGSSALSYFFKLFTHQNINNSKQAEKAAWLQMVERGDYFLPEFNASSWAWFFSIWLQSSSSVFK